MKSLLDRLSIQVQLILLVTLFIAGLLIFVSIGYVAFEEVKVRGSLYEEIIQIKDILADVLPPPEYLVESYGTMYEMLQETDRSALNALISRSVRLRQEYETRHTYWEQTLPESNMKDLLIKKSHASATQFLELFHKEFIPALLAEDYAKARKLGSGPLTQAYNAHRTTIDELVKVLTASQERIEEKTVTIVRAKMIELVLWAGGLMGVGVLFAVLQSRRIRKPLATIGTLLETMAHGEGNLSQRLPVHGQDEIALLCRNFNQFIEKLQQMIGKVAHVTDKVASASVELSATAEEISKGTDSLTSRASQTAAAVEEMNATVSQVAQNSGKAATLAQETVETAKDGGSVVSDTISGMQQLSDAVSSSATIISELGKSSDQIGEIVRVIEDIADQTNLLALNAAIEAARAGEQGRGFAVVADEVRKLAERTTKATKEIGDMIRQIQQDTRGAVESMQQGTVKVTSGVDLVNKTGEALTRIVEMVSESADMIRLIAVASEEQSVATQQIANDIENVAKVTKESASGASESAKASHDLSQLATELQSIVGSFKL